MIIEGTINKNPQSLRDSIDKDLFNKKYFEFKNLIFNLVKNNKSKTFYKFSDGEYFWMNNKQVGSCKPGSRDSNKSTRDLTPFKTGVIKNDYLMCQALNEHVGWYEKTFNKKPEYYVDYSYGLIANKWFTEKFNGNIGLIGAGPKLDAIKNLCKKQEYLDYLRFDGFNDYIKMPQRYLCDQLELGENLLKEGLQKSNSKIFLIGIGHAQQALLHRMKKYKDAVYIVVGSGICAYAGVQDNTRPYFANWINYRSKEFDYRQVDIWRHNFTKLKII